MIFGIVGCGKQNLAVAKINRLLQGGPFEPERSSGALLIEIGEQGEDGLLGQITSFYSVHRPDEGILTPPQIRGDSIDKKED